MSHGLEAGPVFWPEYLNTLSRTWHIEAGGLVFSIKYLLSDSSYLPSEKSPLASVIEVDLKIPSTEGSYNHVPQVYFQIFLGSIHRPTPPNV